MGLTVENLNVSRIEAGIGEVVRRFTIKTAERVLREAVAKGFDNQPVVVTDGMPRRDYVYVKPYGRIEFIRRPQMAEAVLWALDELRKRSPIGRGPDKRPGHPGFYVRSHVVLLNGTEIIGDVRQTLQDVKGTDRVQIVNTTPYARKIEGATASRKTGRGKRRPTSRQAPGGVYRAVVAALVQRYGRSMFFDYKLVKLNLGVKVWGAQGGGKNRKRVLRDQVYPAVQFYIKPLPGLPN